MAVWASMNDKNQAKVPKRGVIMENFPVCGKCKGDSVRFDTTLKWSFDNQEWIISVMPPDDSPVDVFCITCMEETGRAEWYQPNEFCKEDCEHSHCK